MRCPRTAAPCDCDINSAITCPPKVEMLYIPLVPAVSAEQPIILEGTDLYQQQFATAVGRGERSERGEHLSDGGFETLDVHYPTTEAIQQHHDEWKQAQQ